MRAPLDPAGREAIAIDDGLAPGATTIAAPPAVRARGPVGLVCAVPVAAASSAEAVRPYCDELAALDTPEPFGAVGQFYREFGWVSDAQAIAALQ